jgi:predicted nucleotide-binding protein
MERLENYILRKCRQNDYLDRLLAKRLREAADTKQSGDISQPLEALENAGNQVKRAFSGSWLGYHSRVYYEGLVPTPPGANFSQEWGLKEFRTSLGSRGDWREFDPEEVKAHIRHLSGEPDLKPAEAATEKAVAIFGEAKAEILSILENELQDRSDGFLEKLRSELEGLQPMSGFEIAERWAPKGQIITRDMVALGQKNLIPPHISILAEVTAIQYSFDICKAASAIAAKAGSHLERKSRKKLAADRVGTNVFIGHGRSAAWRELKDFVQDRLDLPWDEFNRVPVAGVTNIARLSEMLDAAAIALLVMTAEDEMADGGLQARMNVVHEAGLFQGRLGFTRAIVLLEEGCSEFSNIQGLAWISTARNRPNILGN